MYRSRFLNWISDLAAFWEIYKTDTLLHRSKLNICSCWPRIISHFSKNRWNSIEFGYFRRKSLGILSELGEILDTCRKSSEVFVFNIQNIFAEISIIFFKAIWEIVQALDK